MNSLHHVESAVMERALSEAARTLKKDGRLIVIEPLPKGPFFEAFRSFEDETAVRLDAQTAITRFEKPGLHREKSIEFSRTETFPDFDAFISRTTAADRSRLAIVEQNRRRSGAFSR